MPSASHLILELRAIEQELGKTPTTTIITERSKQNRAYSLNTYYAVFGSFRTALIRARLKPRYKQEFDESDRERMLGELRDLRLRLKRPIFQRNWQPLREAIDHKRLTELPTDEARLLIYNAFTRHKLPVSLFKSVSTDFELSTAQEEPSTLWTMENHFTEAIKKLNPPLSVSSRGQNPESASTRLTPYLYSLKSSNVTQTTHSVLSPRISTLF